MNQPETRTIEDDGPAVSAHDLDLDALFDENCEKETHDLNKGGLQLPPYKRPSLSEISSSSSSESELKRVNQHRDRLPELILPEDVINLPASAADGGSADIAAIKHLKQSLISTHLLLTTHTALAHATTLTSSRLTTVQTQLADAGRWHDLLSAENQRLRSRVQITGRERDNLEKAIERLGRDRSGVEKREVLMRELEEKEKEIERL